MYITVIIRFFFFLSQRFPSPKLVDIFTLLRLLEKKKKIKKSYSGQERGNRGRVLRNFTLNHYKCTVVVVIKYTRVVYIAYTTGVKYPNV